MTLNEILESRGTKTSKAKNLFSLGYTRREVADLLMNGNVGFAYNVWKKWMEEQTINLIQENNLNNFSFSFNRTFGVEIEYFGVTKQRMLTALRNEGVNVEYEGYTHRTTNHWKIVTDSSVSGNNSFELVSPILNGPEGINQLKNVCKAFNKVKAKVNKSCGLHVHFGAQDFDLNSFKNIALNYVNLETTIDNFMPLSRRKNNNQYCRSITTIARTKTASISKIKGANTISDFMSVFGTRYLKLNVKSFQRHGTLEFRHHSGTTTFSKIKNWIYFCARLMEYSKQGGLTSDINNVCNETLKEYIADRTIDLAC